MASRKPFAPNPVVPRISGSLSPAEVVSIISDKCRAEPIGFKNNQKAYVFFTPHAWESLAAATNYGKWVPENELEGQYFLEGYFFADKSGVSSTVVTNVITANCASQGRASAQLYTKENNAYAALEADEKLLAKYSSRGKYNKTGGEVNPFYNEYGPPIRDGHVHTHPNLGCFLSSVDKKSIFAVPGEPWITMVVDPRREELLVAVGADLKIANTVIFRPKTDTQLIISQPLPAKASESDSKDITDDSQQDIAQDSSGNVSEFIKFIASQLDSGCSAKIKIDGRIPGSLKFSGKLNIPKRRKKSSFFDGQAE